MQHLLDKLGDAALTSALAAVLESQPDEASQLAKALLEHGGSIDEVRAYLGWQSVE